MAPSPSSLRTAAHDWTSAPLHPHGKFLLDPSSRICLPRGVNLSGLSKLPSNQDPDSRADFFRHREVCFVGRPFELKDAEEHLERLRGWGLTFVRLLVTWEAIEHEGPGIYDAPYIAYLRALLSLFPKYGIACIINAHQDIWSRLTGGSGAPGWTLELAGLEPQALEDSGAAYLYPLRSQKGEGWDARPGDGLEEGVWPAGYQKAAAGSMATLFWAGATFAPLRTVHSPFFPSSQKVNVQHALQESYLHAFAHLAEELGGCEAVWGFELMNEPHRGYVGLEDFHRWDYNTDLHIAHHPTPLQSFALAAGHAQRVPYYTRSFPFPTRHTSDRLITPPRPAWRTEGEGLEEEEGCWGCPWVKEGVWGWDVERKEPVVLRHGYFRRDPKTGREVEWYKDFYWPFARAFGERVGAAFERATGGRKSWTLVEPIPNEFYPPLSRDDHPRGLVASPHWYDLNALFNKTVSWWSVNVQGLSRGMPLPLALYFGRRGLRSNYALQIHNIVAHAHATLGDVPVLIGECGVPMDLDGGEAFRSGEWKWHEWAFDALIGAMERNLVGFTLWNYNPANTDDVGDTWNGENFSWWSLSHREAERGHAPGDEPSALELWRKGGRVLKAIVRPYAAKIAGTPISTSYDPTRITFHLRLSLGSPPTPSTPLARTTELFVPSLIFFNPAVSTTAGQATYDRARQTVWWDHGEAEGDEGREVEIWVREGKVVGGVGAREDSRRWAAALVALLLALLVRVWFFA